MTSIDFDVSGFTEAAERWPAMAQRSRNAQPAFRSMISDFRARIRLEFATDGAFRGGAWEPLRPAYLENRREEGRGSAILQLVGGSGGRLRESLLGGNAWSVTDVNPQDMRVGTKLGIASIHQTGGVRRIPTKKVTIRKGPAAGTSYTRRASNHVVPARPFIQLDAATTDRWAGFLRDWIIDGDAPGGSGR